MLKEKFPDLNVNAMNEMGDTISVNVLKEAIDNNKKVLLFWYRKISLLYVRQNYTPFKKHCLSLKKNTLVIGASCDTAEVHFAWLNTPKDEGGIEGITYNLLAK